MPRYEGVKSPLMEEGMALNLPADHAQTPPDSVSICREPCPRGTCWWQLPNSEANLTSRGLPGWKPFAADWRCLPQPPPVPLGSPVLHLGYDMGSEPRLEKGRRLIDKMEPCFQWQKTEVHISLCELCCMGGEWCHKESGGR